MHFRNPDCYSRTQKTLVRLDIKILPGKKIPTLPFKTYKKKKEKNWAYRHWFDLVL